MPSKPPPTSQGWLWYAIRTSDCVRLDPRAYGSTVYDGETIPWPDWCCKAPDGGVHIDARVGRIDVHLARGPGGRDEVTWTCNFQVLIFSTDWLAQVQDLIEAEGIALGQVLVDGSALRNWATIHAAHAPRLISSRGRSKVCPICGNHYATLHGKIFFADPQVAGRPLIVGPDGIFVREDEAIRRGLQAPKGGFKPSRVYFRPDQAVEGRGGDV